MAVPKGYKKSSCFWLLTVLSYGGSPPDVKHPSVLEVLMKDLSRSTAHFLAFPPSHFTPSQSLQMPWEVEPAY